ncbi:MAG: thioredoxin domain-containing protein [Bacteriovoracaceae bacterium]|nr:thioredoxin domain-containing protein [Bacteriovoracaceae bacterium]
MLKRKWSILLFIVTFLALIDAVYLVYHHHKINILSIEQPSFCKINEVIDCDIVTKSGYGEFFGVASASIGVFAYFFLSFLFAFCLFGKSVDARKYLVFSYPVMILMALFSLYELAVSILVINAICIMCSLLYVAIILMLIFCKKAIASTLKNIFREFGAFFFPLITFRGKPWDTILFVVNFLLSIIVATIFDFYTQEHFSAMSAQNNMVDKQKNEHSNRQILLNTFEKMKNHDINLENAPFKGSEDAPLIFVEFSDFQCPYCSEKAQSMLELVKEYEGIVKLYFIHYPLDHHCNTKVQKKFHEFACMASMYSICAAEQKKFWEYHDHLFKNQRSINSNFLKSSVKLFKFNKTRFNYCLKEIAPARILEDIDESNRLKLPGTPTIFLNGRNISDTFQSPNQIRRLIDAMIEDAQ